mgnify:CR=1 FL=1
MSVSDIKFFSKLLLAVVGIVVLSFKGGDNFSTAIALIAFVMATINSARIDTMTSQRGHSARR